MKFDKQHTLNKFQKIAASKKIYNVSNLIKDNLSKLNEATPSNKSVLPFGSALLFHTEGGYREEMTCGYNGRWRLKDCYCSEDEWVGLCSGVWL